MLNCSLTSAESVFEIPIEKLRRFNSNPEVRGVKGKDNKYKDLADDIKAHGQLQPIVVRERGDSLLIVDGHRRLAVCSELGFETMKAIIVNNPAISDSQLYISLNESARGFTPREFSGAIARQIDWRGLKQSRLSKQLQRIAKKYGEDIIDYIAGKGMSITSVLAEAKHLLQGLEEEDFLVDFTIQDIAKYLVDKAQQQNSRMAYRMDKNSESRKAALTIQYTGIKEYLG